MSNNTGGPAFPMGKTEAAIYANCIEDLANANLDKAERTHLQATVVALCGMTLRQYAAIHLKVPNSGTDWLDEMIKEREA